MWLYMAILNKIEFHHTIIQCEVDWFYLYISQEE